MLTLDDNRWEGLSHAYGSASDIPGLLRELEALPPDEGSEAEPYFSLWSALCHQGDVYTASYAALPHLCRVIGGSPERVPWTVILMVASIEIARARGHGPAIPADLEPAYRAAIADVPRLVAATAVRPWDHWFCGSALGAIAAVQGHADYAEAILELDPGEVSELLRRRHGLDGEESSQPPQSPAETKRPWWRPW